MAQEIECLPCNCETLSLLNSSTGGREERRKEKCSHFLLKNILATIYKGNSELCSGGA